MMDWDRSKDGGWRSLSSLSPSSSAHIGMSRIENIFGRMSIWLTGERRTGENQGRMEPAEHIINMEACMNTSSRSRRQILKALAIVALVFAVSPVAKADVTDSAADGFTVKITVSIHASPGDVYRRLVDNIGNWWSSDHTLSHDAHNLLIEGRPMGCFCEKLPNGGSVRHMEVILVQPGKTLRMSGAMGPLQALAVSAVATFNLAPEADGTKLEFTYTIGGYAPQGLKGLAPIVDNVLTEQITRLKNYVETGNPASKDKQ
jgi:uncharacterized protein YndB with AHSA1/START domain